MARIRENFWSRYHIANVNTGQVSDVPDSENLFSPRCSRDGRYFAALSAGSSKLMLYDTEKKYPGGETSFIFENW